MRLENNWYRFLEEFAQKFPAAPARELWDRTGDIGALTHMVALAHDLTFAEATEVVTFRLPYFVEQERLSA